MSKFIIKIPIVALVLALSMLAATPTITARPVVLFPEGCCFYNGSSVRTVIPPSATPNDGVDNFYAVPDQKPVVAVAPGDTNYHGGHWAFNLVTWSATPYLLTSEDAVLAAEGKGELTITRVPAKDFLCPLQP